MVRCLPRKEDTGVRFSSPAPIESNNMNHDRITLLPEIARKTPKLLLELGKQYKVIDLSGYDKLIFKNTYVSSTPRAAEIGRYFEKRKNEQKKIGYMIAQWSETQRNLTYVRRDQYGYTRSTWVDNPTDAKILENKEDATEFITTWNRRKRRRKKKQVFLCKCWYSKGFRGTGFYQRINVFLGFTKASHYQMLDGLINKI